MYGTELVDPADIVLWGASGQSSLQARNLISVLPTHQAYTVSESSAIANPGIPNVPLRRAVIKVEQAAR